MSIREERSVQLNPFSLLELALAVEQSTDMGDNCRKFLLVLNKLLGVRKAAIWMLNNVSGKGPTDVLQLIGAYPESITLPASPHRILHSLHQDNAEKLEIPAELEFFKLGKKGFLTLEYETPDSAIAPEEKNYLHRIFDSLAASLEISASYRRLKQAEHQLAITEKKERQIIETSLDAIILVDGDAKVTEWGNRAQELLGYAAEEAIGKRWYQLVYPQSEWSRLDEQVWRFQRFGEFPAEQYQAIDIMAVDKRGRSFPAEFSFSHIEVDGDHHFCLFIRDISSRKAVEAELREAKRTAEAAKLAERKFLTNMSHEIRTPMNTVIGMTHLLSETELNGQQREYLNALKFSADSLLGIINNILDLSKIEAGEFEFNREIFDLRALLNALQQSYRLKLEKRPIRIEKRIDARLEGPVIGDYTRLSQILNNLLSNACNFTEKGDILIEVKVLEEEKSSCRLEFSVRDTGIGIESKKLPLIFQNFKQVGPGGARTSGGSGLGLSIVKQLVELQDGNIVVESEEGKGTSFIFSLPFGKPRGDESNAPMDMPGSGEIDLDLDLTSLRVLVIEDDKMNRLLIRRLLEKWDCEFEMVTKGKDALHLSRTKNFDVILMDLHMWDMDGIETTRRLRKESGNPNRDIPIIALTAAALLEEKRRAFEAGMNDFLTKPFSPPALRNALAKVREPGRRKGPKATNSNTSFPGSLRAHFKYLNDFSKGDEAFIREMIETFLEELSPVMTAVKEATAARDGEKISNLAHRLKPSLQMLELTQLLEKTKLLEKELKSGPADWVVTCLQVNEWLAGLAEAEADLRDKIN